MSRKVEVCQCADSVEDVGSVMVDPDVKLLCCASNMHLLQVIKYTTLRDLHDKVCLIL